MLLQITQQQQQQTNFKDPDFPHQLTTITKDSTSMEKVKQFTWRRIPEFTNSTNIKIFDDHISPCDIKKGNLNDNYLITSIQTLVTRPHLITRIFETIQYTDLGLYSIWLCTNGQWKLWFLDDYFPCQNKFLQPAFTFSSSPTELWILFVEKAFAKQFGSYQSLEVGLTGLAIRDLTGAPYDYLFIKQNEQYQQQRSLQQPISNEQIWQYIEDNLKQNFFITATPSCNFQKKFQEIQINRQQLQTIQIPIKNNDEQNRINSSDKNINKINAPQYIDSHPLLAMNNQRNICPQLYQSTSSQLIFDYTVLELKQLKNKFGVLEKLVKLQNASENNYPWPLQSDDWDNETWQSFNFQALQQEGIVWSRLSDFCSNFISLCINKIYEEYFYQSLNIDMRGQKHFVVKIQIRKNKTHLFLTVSQKDQRHFFQEKGKENYQYSFVRLILCRGTQDYPKKFIKDKFQRGRDVYIECTLNVGTYILYVEMDWNQDYANDLTVSSYSEKQLDFWRNVQFYSQDQLHFVDNILQTKLPQTDEDIHLYEAANNICRIKCTAMGYVYFIYQNCSYTTILQETVELQNIVNLHICAPYTNTNKFEVEVQPNQVKIVKFIINYEQGDSYCFQAKFSSKLFQKQLSQLMCNQ